MSHELKQSPFAARLESMTAGRASRRRLVSGAAALGLSGALLPALPGAGVVAAQDILSEAIVPMELAPGVTAAVFAGAPSARAAGQTVYLARFVFEPGAAIFAHSHPGTTILGGASGVLGWTLQAGKAWLVRGAGAGATGPAEEVAELGAEVLLAPGDAIYYEEDTVHTARGASEGEPAVVMGTLVLTADAPLLMPADMDMSATQAT